MTRVISLLLFLIPSAASAQDLVIPSDRVTTHINVRATPAEDGVDIGDVEIGEGLPLVGSVPRWHQCGYPEGRLGLSLLHESGTLCHGGHYHLQRENVGDCELLYSVA